MQSLFLQETNYDIRPEDRRWNSRRFQFLRTVMQSVLSSVVREIMVPS